MTQTEQDITHSVQPVANSAQIEYWNTAVGEKWARLQEDLDRQLGPLGEEGMRVLAVVRGERVLDVGCGCGATSLKLAAGVGLEGRVVGVDISRPMLGVARRRPLPEGAVPPEFLEADVQSAALGAGTFDAVFSRFGVMFFADPTTAFVNIRRALRPGGRLVFVCWRPLQENAWMREPLEAAAPHLPPSEPSHPTAPGPFAFADLQRVRGVLAGAGFVDVRVEPFDTRIGGGDIEYALRLSLAIGPLASALREHPECTAAVTEAVRVSLLRHASPRGIRLPAAVWIVTAKA